MSYIGHNHGLAFDIIVGLPEGAATRFVRDGFRRCACGTVLQPEWLWDVSDSIPRFGIHHTLYDCLGEVERHPIHRFVKWLCRAGEPFLTQWQARLLRDYGLSPQEISEAIERIRKMDQIHRLAEQMMVAPVKRHPIHRAVKWLHDWKVDLFMPFNGWPQP